MVVLEADVALRPFISTFTNKVDRKGRVSVPAKFRAVLQAAEYNSIVVRPDPVRGCLEGYGMDRLERLAEATPETLDIDEAGESYQILAESEELPFDPNGRVLIPDHLLDAAGIGETAVFVGLGRLFQIWDPDAYATFKQDTLRAAAARKAKAKDAAGRTEGAA